MHFYLPLFVKNFPRQSGEVIVGKISVGKWIDQTNEQNHRQAKLFKWWFTEDRSIEWTKITNEINYLVDDSFKCNIIINIKTKW